MLRKAFFAFSAIVLISSATIKAESTTTTPFKGITCTQRTETLPRLLNINVVEIDLEAAGISFYVTPGNGDFVAGETTPQRTQDFMDQAGAQLAVNTNFFAYSGGGTDLYGLSYSKGYPVSFFSSTFAASLNISQNNDVSLITSNPLNTQLYNTVSGYGVLLQNGTNTAPTNDSLFTASHPRSAIGYSADKKKMVIMTVDGRQTGVSLGLSAYELGNLMLEYGVHNAINLDGGGSTTLAINDGVSRLKNIPSDNPARAVGSSLAIYATPNYAPSGQTPNLIAYESFDYARCTPGHTENTKPTSGGLNTLMGGQGWAGGWYELKSKDGYDGYIYSGIATYETDSDISGNKTAPLAYSDSTGKTLQTQGAQMRTSYGGCSVTTRYIDLSKVGSDMIKDGQIGADGSEVCVSFLAQSYATNDFAEAFIQLGDGVRFGMLKNNKWGVQDSQNTSNKAFSQINVGDSAMFLAKLLFQNGQDRVQVWFNPELEGLDNLNNPDIDMLVSDFTFSDVNIIGTYSTDFDELRIGTNYQAVAPTNVPEPATIVLTSLAFLALRQNRQSGIKANR